MTSGHEEFMAEAPGEARKSLDVDEFPVGARSIGITRVGERPLAGRDEPELLAPRGGMLHRDLVGDRRRLVLALSSQLKIGPPAGGPIRVVPYVVVSA